MTAVAFDPAAFGGTGQASPIPLVICWDELDTAGYTQTLGELARWLEWFRITYRVPATAVPPCWYQHPGIREDLGHLWTGWLVTRHPDAGVGMIGLEWDGRRDQTISRLRESVATTGCTSSRHQDEPDMPTPDPGDREWADHLEGETYARDRSSSYDAAIEVITEALQDAELRHDLAPDLLSEIAQDPTAATAQDRDAVAEQLRRLAEHAAHDATNKASAAVRAVTDQHRLADQETAVAAARRMLAHTAATAATTAITAITAITGADGDAAISTTTAATAVTRWLTALEELLPAGTAADRAAAAAAARTAAVDRRVTAMRRHPDITGLLGTPHPTAAETSEGP